MDVDGAALVAQSQPQPDGVDLVDLEVSTKNQDGIEVIKGTATARLEP